MAKLLDEYRAKRDFKKTPEPQGKPAKGQGFSFCIQKHDATRLHYDFRLELDGVLKSWAVTRGPSLVPGEKRLAVQTEDHPLEYGEFEGTIPEGEYGGGTVLLWDRGRWQPEGDPHKALAKGNLDFSLEGEKLRGRWHLVRMRPRPGEKKSQWLLIKSTDEAARTAEQPDILEEQPLSAKTGRSLDEIAADAKSAVWHSNRGTPDEKAKSGVRGGRSALSAAIAREAQRARKPSSGAEDGAADAAQSRGRGTGAKVAARATADLSTGGKKAAMPSEIAPSLATLVEDVPSGDKWVYEIKWDGYRLVAFVRNGKAELRTRKGLDWTHRFPGVAKALAALPVERAIIDGEALIEDESGLSSFSALQEALSEHRAADKAIFCAFDLLYLDGVDLRELLLVERKRRLAALVPPGAGGALRFSEHIEGDGEAMLRNACRLGLEGIIAKRGNRPYRSGRHEEWLKIKCSQRQEFVIGGFTPSSAQSRAVGSLLLGYYGNGRLRHAGRTGTGFTAASARDMWKRLQPLKVKTSPFTDTLTTLQRRDANWVRPELVAEVEFRGWTHDLHVRHAAFKGLREDKDPHEVIREATDGGNDDAPRRSKATTAAKASGSSDDAPQRREAKKRAPAGGGIAGVKLTHPDRILWEDQGVTKQGLAEFYEEIADWILPHLVHRPLSLVRCPSGVQAGCFYQKHSWAGRPDVIRRDSVGEEEVLYIEDLGGLIALVQSAVLEIHPWGSRIGDVDRPDRIIMDLDPGEGVEWAAVIEGACEVRDRLHALGLKSFVKTTGGKGLHVVVPLTPKADWDEVKAFARGISEAMQADSPRRYISTMAKKARRGLIYVDYLRNGQGATAVAAYSTRARAGAPVSVPLAWDELSTALKPNHFNVANLPTRLQTLGDDPWAALFKLKQTLPAAGRKPRAARRTK